MALPTIQSTNEEIAAFCENEASQAPGYGHEMKLNYGVNLLAIKQQKKLIDDQNNYNRQMLATNRKLVYATWVLAAATILLALLNFHR
jgi:hypothetical protein